MIWSIIYHEKSGFPPVGISQTQLLYQSEQVQLEGLAVGLPSVHCEEELTMVADCSNNIQTWNPFHINCECFLTLLAPALSLGIRGIKYTFIDVDDSEVVL